MSAWPITVTGRDKITNLQKPKLECFFGFCEFLTGLRENASKNQKSPSTTVFIKYYLCEFVGELDISVRPIS